MDEMVPLTAAAQELGVSRATLFRWLKAREVTVYRRIGDKQGYVERSVLDSLRGWYAAGKTRRPAPARGAPEEEPDG